MNPTIQALFSSSLNLEEKTEGRVEVNITSNCIMLYGRPYGQNMEYYQDLLLVASVICYVALPLDDFEFVFIRTTLCQMVTVVQFSLRVFTYYCSFLYYLVITIIRIEKKNGDPHTCSNQYNKRNLSYITYFMFRVDRFIKVSYLDYIG